MGYQTPKTFQEFAAEHTDRTVSYEDYVADFLLNYEGKEPPKYYLNNWLKANPTGNNKGQLGRILNQLKSITTEPSDQFVPGYQKSIQNNYFVYHIIKKIDDFVEALFDQDGILKERFINIFAQVTNKTPDEMKELLYGSKDKAGYNKKSVDELTKMMIAGALIAESSAFTAAAMAGINADDPNFNDPAHAFLYENIYLVAPTDKDHIQNPTYDDFSTLSTNLTFAKLQEYKNPANALKDFEAKLQDTIRKFDKWMENKALSPDLLVYITKLNLHEVLTMHVSHVLYQLADDPQFKLPYNYIDNLNRNINHVIDEEIALLKRKLEGQYNLIDTLKKERSELVQEASLPQSTGFFSKFSPKSKSKISNAERNKEKISSYDDTIKQAVNTVEMLKSHVEKRIVFLNRLRSEIFGSLNKDTALLNVLEFKIELCEALFSKANIDFDVNDLNKLLYKLQDMYASGNLYADDNYQEFQRLASFLDGLILDKMSDELFDNKYEEEKEAFITDYKKAIDRYTTLSADANSAKLTYELNALKGAFVVLKDRVIDANVLNDNGPKQGPI